jgi:hypothetical protein
MKRIATIVMALTVHSLMGQATYFGPNYLHLDDGSNCVANYTILDASVVGSNPSDILLFTHVKGVAGRGHDAIMPLSRGVWWDGFAWTIFNEYIPGGMDTAYAFNVLNAKNSGTGFTHTVTAANSYGNYSEIDNSLLNGHPEAVFFISKSFGIGVTELAHVGIFYDGPNWSVYNEATANPLQVNSTYNIFVPESGTSCYKHTATSSNYMTMLDHPLLNGNPDAKIIVIHNLSSGVYDLINDELGVWYDGSHWNIYNENIDTLYTGAVFNVLIMADFPTGIQPITNSNNRLIAYPNPAKDYITVLLDKAITRSEYSISLSSLDGKKIIQTNNRGDLNEKTVIDVTGLAGGLYLVTANTVNGTFFAKVNVKK